MWQRVALIVLFAFLSIARVTPGVLDEGASACPDQSEHGDHRDPCGPACSCTCCPGHGASLLVLRERVEEGGALVADSGSFPALDDRLHPRDVTTRLFRPPRA